LINQTIILPIAKMIHLGKILLPDNINVKELRRKEKHRIKNDKTT
jgi:hypothetical protein